MNLNARLCSNFLFISIARVDLELFKCKQEKKACMYLLRINLHNRYFKENNVTFQLNANRLNVRIR